MKDCLIPKYYQWHPPLDDMKCLFIKADVSTLLTLTFNEGIIIDTIDVFLTIAMPLGFTDEIVSNKIVKIRMDLFIV